MTGCTLGENCNIGQNVVVSPDVILGSNAKVQNNVSIYTGVICDDDVFLGPSMVFTNITNPRSAVIRRGEYSKTIVKKGASIGANATIVCGHDIGDYAFIGAGTVITKKEFLFGNYLNQGFLYDIVLKEENFDRKIFSFQFPQLSPACPIGKQSWAWG